MTTSLITHRALLAQGASPPPATAAELQAVRRLIRLAMRDSDEARRAAEFLLAWWNGGSCGGFDLVNLWGVPRSAADDMVTVFGMIARVVEYPHRLAPDFDRDFRMLVRLWRPELTT